MNAEFSISTSNGISAVLNVARGLIGEGAPVYVSETTYYEVALRLKREAKLRNWSLFKFNPWNLRDLESALASWSGGGRPCFWIDQPSNWWLEAYDIRALSEFSKKWNGILVVDVSVHPLTPVLEQGADVAIVSLSKFPSNGLSQGGMILTNDVQFSDALIRQRDHDGSMLAAEAAFAIHSELLGFEDRFTSIAEKAGALCDFSRDLPGIVNVRYPDAGKLETSHGGGVLVLELKNVEVGACAEEIVSQNHHRADFALARICTFGCAYTTFEHFESRGSKNDEVVPSLIRPLPDNFCRIGVGCEPLRHIKEALQLVFPDIEDSWIFRHYPF